MKSAEEKVGTVISVDIAGKESAGIILDKKGEKTYGFFFDSKKGNFKSGDKVKYRINGKTGVASKVMKI